MPIAADVIRQIERPDLTIPLRLDGEPESVALTYDAHPVTPGWWRRAGAWRDAADERDQLAGMLAGVVLAWDVTRDGEPLPIETGTLAPLHLDFLRLLAAEIALHAFRRAGLVKGGD